MIPTLRHANGVLQMGDCLDLMKHIPSGSVDMILCDLPYGTTQNKWDSIIPFEPLWEEYWRVCKPNAAIVLTAQSPFDKMLGASQIQHFKYEWIWEKSRPTGHMNAKKQPLRAHENALVFYREQPVYNPKMEKGEKNHVNRKPRIKTNSDNHGKQYEMVERISNEKYPRSVQYFKTISPTYSLHPTQKPVDLFKYMIETYTNPGDMVLDNCSGSGTTAISAYLTGRRWHCIERDAAYYLGAIERILKECVE